MDDDIAVIVRMRVECARCGHAEDDTYEFDLPFAKAHAMEAYEPGKCPKCGGRLSMHDHSRPFDGRFCTTHPDGVSPLLLSKRLIELLGDYK